MLTTFPAPLKDGASSPVWFDLLDATRDEIAHVERATGFTIPDRAALSEVETSSRLRNQRGALYLSTPILAGADTEHAELTPVGFILTPQVLVTVRFCELRVFDAAQRELVHEPDPCSTAVFVALIEAIVDRAADLLEIAGAELDEISRTTFSSATVRHHVVKASQRLRLTLASVGYIGDRLGHIRGSLLGVGRIAPFVNELGRSWIKPDFATRLNATRTDVASLDDYEAHLANKSQFLLDAVLGFINVEQNDLFKILTIVSVVGVPPTLIASIYGMNFKEMPELQWHLGYPYALGLIALTTIAPMVWFKWKGWW